MNFLRVSFTAANHKTFRHMLRSGVSSKVNIVIRGFATAAGKLESEQVVEKMNRRGDSVTYKTTLINDSSKAEEPSRADLIDAFCKQGRFDDVYRLLNEMFDSGFYPSFFTLKDVITEFLRIGDTRKAYELLRKMYEFRGKILELRRKYLWGEEYLWLLQGLSDEVTYTSLMNAYLDEGKWDYAKTLFHEVRCFCSLSFSVVHSVIINGLDKKDRTTEVKKYLLRSNYEICLDRPILEYHSTMVENSSDDEFRSVVELVEGICIKGLENVFDTMLKLNYKPDGIDDEIVYNLFIFAHCQHYNVDEAYIMYQDMVHYGFACHMFTVFALIKALERENMVTELLWVIQNVLRSCNLNDSEIVNYLNEFNPKKPISEALFDVLAEKARDGLFLKCSYAPASA